MQEYDTALKLLLQDSKGSVLKQVTGVSVERWLNVELRRVKENRADLLGQTSENEILHVELQSTNDRHMVLRMAEYCLSIYRQYRKLPRQIVLYVGEAKMRMKTTLAGPDQQEPDLRFRYKLVDFRELDGAGLLASGDIRDNLLAILARLPDQAAAIRQIMKRIAGLDDSARREVFAQFLIIAGLRSLGHTIREEANKMPIMSDILDHDLLGPAIRQGRQEGLQEGLQRGGQRALREAVRQIVEKRFGSAPSWLAGRLGKLSATDLNVLLLKAVDASSVEELFSHPSP